MMKKYSGKMNYDVNTVRGGVSFNDAVQQRIVGDTPIKNALRPHFYSFSYLLLSAYSAFLILFHLFYPLMIPTIEQSGQYAVLVGALVEIAFYLIPLILVSLASGRLLLMVIIMGGMTVNLFQVWFERRKAEKSRTM
ncbi:hypothetical protein [Providencia heimbachae]|uniref:hypothetical protein n=1 Tax=Providencia heimbachae TaxID=333962 RepID=UPI00224088D1|nr:hypothetical protein [Providencia heimbachae]